jgi:hypothetical protein
MRSRQILGILTLLISLNGISQITGARGTYIFPAFNGVSIPDSLKNEDAIFVENIRTYDFMEDFRSEIVVFERIYINSEVAAEEYSQREMMISNDGFMAVLAARTLKKDGSVLTLDGDQIIETISKKKNKYGNETVRRIQFVYPNVEVGDVIDLAYQLNLNHYIYSDLLHLEDDIPSLHSRVNLRNISMLDLTVFRLNDAPAVVTGTDAGAALISWEKYGVSTLKSDYYNALPPDFPGLIFILWSRGQQLDYKTIYEYDAVEFPENYSPLTSIEKILREQGVLGYDEDTFVQLKKVINYLEKDCTWNFEPKGSNVNKSIDYLENAQVDQQLFLRYIMKFLGENRIRYEKGFSKSLLKGQFVHGVVSLEQLSQRFLVIYDHQDEPHFLFPPRGKDQFYYLDEIPYYLEGNQSICLLGEKNFLKERASILIPESRVTDNTQVSQISLNVEKDSLKSVYTRTDKFSGHYSYLTRDLTGAIWLDELNVSPDSVIIEPISSLDYYPYTSEFKQEDLSGEFFVNINDSLMWFMPKNLLPKGLYQGDEKEGEFGEYVVLPFVKQHNISIFVKSTAPIIISEDEQSLTYKNDIGSLEMTLYQMTENVVKVRFDVQVNKRKLAGQEITQFEDLLQNYSEIVNKKWVLKN